MIRISQLKLPITHTQAQLEKKILKTLKNPGSSFTYEIKKQSLDCRHKNDKIFVYYTGNLEDGSAQVLRIEIYEDGE